MHQEINAYLCSFADSHIASLAVLGDLLDRFIAAPSVGEDADDLRGLAGLLQHQPFSPNYAESAPPHSAHLSSLLADESEEGQKTFLLRLLRASR